MKNIHLLLSACCFFIVANTHAAWDIYKAGLSVNGGYYDCQLDGLSPNFQHTNFGRYTSGGSIEINFAELLTFKNGASNVCSATMRYRVYRTCDTPPAFSSQALSFCCNFGGTDCSGGACGPDVSNTGDQKWRGVPSSTLNLLSGLTASGLYVIEVYFEATGDDSGGCTNTKFSSNGGANFRAYFEYDVNDISPTSIFLLLPGAAMHRISRWPITPLFPDLPAARPTAPILRSSVSLPDLAASTSVLKLQRGTPNRNGISGWVATV